LAERNNIYDKMQQTDPYKMQNVIAVAFKQQHANAKKVWHKTFITIIVFLSCRGLRRWSHDDP